MCECALNGEEVRDREKKRAGGKKSGKG